MRRHRKRHRDNLAVLGAVAVADDPKVEHTPGDLLEDACSTIDRILIDLCIEAPLVAALTDSRQRGLGFLTPEAKRAQDSQLKKERQAHAQRLKAGQPVGPGASPAPGNVSGLSVDADLWVTLSHQVRQVRRHLAARLRHRLDRDQVGIAGPFVLVGEVNTWLGSPAPKDSADLARHLRELVWKLDDPDTDLKLVTRLERDLEHLHTSVDRLVEGDDRSRHPSPCPHCGRKSLVIWHREGVIRCDRDPHTHRYQPCRCDAAVCQCRTNPVHHRHQWIRDLGAKPGSWWALVDLLNRPRPVPVPQPAPTAEPDTSTEEKNR